MSVRKMVVKAVFFVDGVFFRTKDGRWRVWLCGQGRGYVNPCEEADIGAHKSQSSQEIQDQWEDGSWKLFDVQDRADIINIADLVLKKTRQLLDPTSDEHERLGDLLEYFWSKEQIAAEVRRRWPPGWTQNVSCPDLDRLKEIVRQQPTDEYRSAPDFLAFLEDGPRN